MLNMFDLVGLLTANADTGGRGLKWKGPDQSKWLNLINTSIATKVQAESVHCTGR